MTKQKLIKAKLTFEYDGKTVCIWNLKFPEGGDTASTFKGIEMGYYNGTLLEAITEEFNKQ
jgi:hypothetical protein